MNVVPMSRPACDLHHAPDRLALRGDRWRARARALHEVVGNLMENRDLTNFTPSRPGPARGIAHALRLAGTVGALAAALLLAAPAHAQVAFRGAASAGVAATGDITHVGAGAVATNDAACPRSVSPARPAGNVGDLLIALAVAREDAATAATPAGWNLFYSATYNPVGQDFRVFIFYRIATGTLATQDTITITESGTCGSLAARVSRFRGVDATQPFLNVPIPGANVVMQNANNIDTGTETTIDPNAMLLVASFANDDNNITEGAGWNVSFESPQNMNRDLMLNLHYQLQTTAGAKSVSNWSQGANDENIGVIFSLRPTGLRVNVPAGTLANDVMVASIAWRDSPIVVTSPAGWTPVRETVQAGGGGGTSRLATYVRVAGGAEPASYLWTFSNGSSVGAVGGITSFSGVDVSVPANIVNAEGGAATGSSGSHTAPSINTTVGGTMLVGSFEFDSSTSNWTPPAGMTEAVDVGSLPPPDDLGISMEMTYEVQGASGATGTRTATANTTGANTDQGAAHLLALRSLVVIVTPGSFNAFETGTAGGAITGVIRTKVAGSAFGLDVVSIAAGVQQAAFTDQVIVELLGNNTLGVSLDANNCPTTFTLVQTVSPNPTITAGRSTVNFAAVPNSWRDVRVRVRWPTTSPSVVSCSTDNFAIRPSSLTVSATDASWTTAGNARTLNNTAPSGGTVHKAGQPFRVTAVPQPGTVTQYAGSPTISSVTCLTLAGMTGCTSGTVALPAGGWSGTGTRVNDTASYSEVGALTLVLEDATFASVDNADSSVAERVITQTASIQAGRFVPDRFVVAPANAPQFRTFGAICAAPRSFTYLGQTFDYVTTPVALVTAQNAAGITTTNYRESLWKITTTAPSDVTQTYGNGTGPALDVSLATNAPAVAPASNGTGTVTVSALDRIAHTRPAAPIVSFNADISLTVAVRDDSEAEGQITTTTATPFSTIAFDSGTQFRFGRLQVGAASGSHLVALALPLETQYWNGSAFVTNAADNCTALAAANVGLGNFIGLASGDTTPSLSGAFSAGRKTLTLSPPGGNKVGTVDVVINLNATAGAYSSCTAFAPAPTPTAANLAHLRGRWCGPSPDYDRDVAARARFGIYRGAEEVIFVRENY